MLSPVANAADVNPRLGVCRTGFTGGTRCRPSGA
jgi:hypothetical protein